MAVRPYFVRASVCNASISGETAISSFSFDSFFEEDLFFEEPDESLLLPTVSSLFTFFAAAAESAVSLVFLLVDFDLPAVFFVFLPVCFFSLFSAVAFEAEAS